MPITRSGRFLVKVVAGLGLLTAVLAPGAASAQAYTGATPPQVGPVDLGGGVLGSGGTAGSGSSGSSGGGVGATGRGAATAVRTPPASTGTSDSGGLPVTGSDALQLALLGLGAVGAGTALVLKSRTRQAV